MGATWRDCNRILLVSALLWAGLFSSAKGQDAGASYRAPVSGKPLVWEGGTGAQAPGQKAQPEQPKSKFPNIDTAKNRQDYDMSTADSEGADGISIGRDAKTGENVVRHVPPKKERQKAPGEDMPLDVRPIIVPNWQGNTSK